MRVTKYGIAFKATWNEVNVNAIEEKGYRYTL